MQACLERMACRTLLQCSRCRPVCRSCRLASRHQSHNVSRGCWGVKLVLFQGILRAVKESQGKICTWVVTSASISLAQSSSARSRVTEAPRDTTAAPGWPSQLSITCAQPLNSLSLLQDRIYQACAALVFSRTGISQTCIALAICTQG